MKQKDFLPIMAKCILRVGLLYRCKRKGGENVQMQTSLMSKEIIESFSSKDKPRSVHELTARYNQRREEYQRLRSMMGDSPEQHEQLSMIYAEAKALAWALGRSDQSFIKDISGKA